jgi:hypothetical protein
MSWLAIIVRKVRQLLDSGFGSAAANPNTVGQFLLPLNGEYLKCETRIPLPTQHYAMRRVQE